MLDLKSIVGQVHTLFIGYILVSNSCRTQLKISQIEADLQNLDR